MWYYVGVKSSFQHAREECNSKRAYVFRCLMFSLSRPCELLFLLMTSAISHQCTRAREWSVRSHLW